MMCKWCEWTLGEIVYCAKVTKVPNKVHAFWPGDGTVFFACDECLKKHGRTEKYEVPSGYDDLLVSLGV